MGTKSRRIAAIKNKASLNNAENQNNLGLKFKELGNIGKAKEWFQKAADQNHANAQYSLGVISYKEEHNKQAKEWFQKAADQNHANAQYNLGVIFYKENNIEKAKEWFQKSTNQNHAEAQEALRFIIYGVSNIKQVETLLQKIDDHHRDTILKEKSNKGTFQKLLEKTGMFKYIVDNNDQDNQNVDILNELDLSGDNSLDL